MAAAAGRGQLRASHADRDRVIDLLKTAFVQGRLTKDELDARVGQALVSRTHAELATLTTDIPVGLMAAPQRRDPARRRTGKVVVRAGFVVLPAAMLAAAFLSGNEQVFKLCLLVVPWFIIGWVMAGTQALGNWLDKRSGRQLPPPPARRIAEQGRRDRGPGGGLILCQARGGGRLYGVRALCVSP
jgi:hypothetical protein